MDQRISTSPYFTALIPTSDNAETSISTNQEPKLRDVRLITDGSFMGETDILSNLQMPFCVCLPH